MNIQMPSPETAGLLHAPPETPAPAAGVSARGDPRLDGRLPRGGHAVSRGRIAVRLASAFGFCPGVRRALRLAVEARRAFPSRRVVLAGPLVHNPQVQAALAAWGIEGPLPGGLLPVPDDVVILPAFGLPPEKEKRLRATGARLVDTACGSVRAVWRSVERLSRDGFTVVYHGEPGHEEAEATLARVGGPWCVARNAAEAEDLAACIPDAWSAARGAPGAPTAGDPRPTPGARRSSLHASPGFDPALHLRRIGLAHQTTMLSSESLRVAEALRGTMARQWGTDSLPGRFRDFDTLCPAMQERQDAVDALGREGVDVFLVVGGRRSNNTRGLTASASRWAPAYQVEGPEDLLGSEAVRCWKVEPHRDSSVGPGTISPWLPPGPVVVGVTAGASTPDAVTEGVVERVLGF